MKSFNRLDDLINLLRSVEEISRSYQLKELEISAVENILYKATKEIVIDQDTLYGITIDRITFLPLEATDLICGFHVYLKSTTSLLSKLIQDIGSYSEVWSWGFTDNNTPKGFCWTYGYYQVALRKEFKLVQNYSISAPKDIISITTEVYKHIK